MLLLEKKFTWAVESTDTAVEQVGRQDFQEAGARLGADPKNPHLPDLFMVWADLLALIHPGGGRAAFGQPDAIPGYNFRENAVALLDAAGTRNLKMLRLTAQKAVQTSDLNNLQHLMTVLATCLRDVLEAAGGRERLMNSARLHHAHVRGHLTNRQTKMVVSPAALIAAMAANSQWEPAYLVIRRLKEAVPDAYPLLLQTWLRVTANEQMLPGDILEIRDGVPDAFVVPDNPSSKDSMVRTSSLFVQAAELLRAGDAEGLASTQRDIEALPAADYEQIVWVAACSVGSYLSHQPKAPDTA